MKTFLYDLELDAGKHAIVPLMIEKKDACNFFKYSTAMQKQLSAKFDWSSIKRASFLGSFEHSSGVLSHSKKELVYDASVDALKVEAVDNELVQSN